MDFINKIEYAVIDLEVIISTFKFVSNYFEEKIHEDYSYLIKSDKDLYYELRSIQTLNSLLYKALEEIRTSCQNEIELFYKELA